MGLHYEVGAIIEPNCTTRCTCRGGYFDCIEQVCIADGSTCYVFGYAHYQTFDMKYFDFQENCEYILTQPYNSSVFTITAGNTMQTASVAFPNFIRIIVPIDNLEILLGRNKQGGIITINDVIHIVNDDRVVLQSDAVKVIRIQGSFYVLLTTYHVKIFWDGINYAAITVDSVWENKLSGLCGNYNAELNDEFEMPNGSLASVANEFGSSWLFGNTSLNCTMMPISNFCQASDVVDARVRCNNLLSSIFNACSNAVDPLPFVKNCIADYCSCNETDREDCYCNSLATYAAACAAKSIIIPNWRKVFCCK